MKRPRRAIKWKKTDQARVGTGKNDPKTIEPIDLEQQNCVSELVHQHSKLEIPNEQSHQEIHDDQYPVQRELLTPGSAVWRGANLKVRSDAAAP